MFLVIVIEVKKMSIVAHNSEGVTDKNGFIFLNGEEAGMPEVIVQTTHATVEEMINKYSKKVCKNVFPKVWNVLKNTNVDATYNEGGEAWSNLMDDILIFYICRHKLFGTLLPCVVNPKLTSHTEKIGSTKSVFNFDTE
jgi:hypothetical protein